jgi:hypothetical protein
VKSGSSVQIHIESSRNNNFRNKHNKDEFHKLRENQESIGVRRNPFIPSNWLTLVLLYQTFGNGLNKRTLTVQL